jgi:hypothetical protein
MEAEAGLFVGRIKQRDASLGHRPDASAPGVGYRSCLAANPLQMQPDGARAWSVARQLRDGNTPNSAMHCVKGKPVAVKIGFAVGSAKLVVPLPP